MNVRESTPEQEGICPVPVNSRFPDKPRYDQDRMLLLNIMSFSAQVESILLSLVKN